MTIEELEAENEMLRGELEAIKKERDEARESILRNAEQAATISDGTRKTSGEGWRLWCEEAEAERDALQAKLDAVQPSIDAANHARDTYKKSYEGLVAIHDATSVKRLSELRAELNAVKRQLEDKPRGRADAGTH